MALNFNIICRIFKRHNYGPFKCNYVKITSKHGNNLRLNIDEDMQVLNLDSFIYLFLFAQYLDTFSIEKIPYP